jgi:predicted phage terminase large subunit-like protein
VKTTPATLTTIPDDLLAHATPAELALYEQALSIQLALSSPADWAEAVSAGRYLRDIPHLELTNDLLVRLIDGKLGKRGLIVSIPVRHGKSELVSKYTPGWFLARYPERKVAVATYEADFAAEWGRKAKDVIADAPAHLAPRLRKDSRAAHRWETEEGGGMFTAGVGGPLTGKGFHLLVVDDPIKNHAEAMSETVRQRTHDWFLSTALTRMEPGGVVVILMARWHEDDLVGRLLRDEPQRWHHVSLPALAIEGDALGRMPGEALWPARYDAEALGGLRSALGPQLFASLYQQSPYIDGGGIFRAEKFRYYSTHEGDTGPFVRLRAGADDVGKVVPMAQVSKFGVVDLAATTKTTSDWSVYALFGVTPSKELLLLERFRARIEGADHMPTLERLHGLWKPRFWGIERATYGLTLLQTATRIGKIPVRELKPDWDKVSRAYSAGALVEAGRFYWPRGAPWLEEWEAEHLAFPNGTHDDQVDVSAYAALVLSERLHAPRPGRRPEPTSVEERIWAQIERKRKAARTHPVLGSF